MNKAQRRNLAVEVYDRLYEGTDSFEELCPAVAYLIPAILKGDRVGLCPSVLNESDGDLLMVLRKLYPDPNHVVWQFVEVLW